jgi:hypothetical protein
VIFSIEHKFITVNLFGFEFSNGEKEIEEY